MLQHEFSWSASRYTLFNHCKRAYYYHYYGSWRGWEEDIDTRTKKIYLLKNLRTVEEWISGIFKRSLNEALNSGRWDINRQKRRAFSMLRNDICDIRSKSWEHSPKCINIDELYYDTATVNRVVSSGERILNTIFANLAESKIKRRIEEVSYLKFKRFRTPAYFYNDGLKVLCSPDITWEDGGVLYICNFFTGDPQISNSWALKSGVDAIFAEKEWMQRKIDAVSIFPDQPPPPAPVHITGNIKEIKSLIKTSSDEMLALTNLDTEIYEESFANCADSTICRRCKYREICSDFLTKE
jgi:hypothetical protein